MTRQLRNFDKRTHTIIIPHLNRRGRKHLRKAIADSLIYGGIGLAAWCFVDVLARTCTALMADPRGVRTVIALAWLAVWVTRKARSEKCQKGKK